MTILTEDERDRIWNAGYRYDTTRDLRIKGNPVLAEPIVERCVHTNTATTLWVRGVVLMSSFAAPPFGLAIVSYSPPGQTSFSRAEQAFLLEDGWRPVESDNQDFLERLNLFLLAL